MVIERLFEPRHPASLAVTRILFGMLMVLDIPGERGGSEIDVRWGDAKTCHFPLVDGLFQPSYPCMCLMYGAMWLGALGICIGYKFKIASVAFLLPYWYIMLLDKSFWNNHTYLYGLLGILIGSSSANSFWSIDAWRSSERQQSVPYWNYFLLKFQVFCLYFMAGLKKMDMEWLDGYAMRNLGNHWVFTVFRFLLPSDVIDYLLIHWTGFLLDLSIGFLLICEKSRPLALLGGVVFHAMNSRLFSIGMFPYVGIATLPLFCHAEWPIRLLTKLTTMKIEDNLDPIRPGSRIRRHCTIFCICLYCFLQICLPWSHFITKGYNHWTNGIYGYSWDMMVHSWDTLLLNVRIQDNENKRETFLDPYAWTLNDRWSKHPDMLVQYAKCVQRNLNSQQIVSDNISIYVDVWCSLNGRFQQRLVHSQCDLLHAEWSPFERVNWTIPLLSEFDHYRPLLQKLQQDVYSWSNYSDVIFASDLPGMWFENFIAEDLVNITLCVIDGKLYVQGADRSQGVVLRQGDRLQIQSEVMHKVRTIGHEPSRFMYTFINRTKMEKTIAIKDRLK